MSWPEKESLDEMMRRFARKCLAERKEPKPHEWAQARRRAKAEVEPAPPPPAEIPERMDRPPLRRRRLPPQTERFPTDEELDRMWSRAPASARID